MRQIKIALSHLFSSIFLFFIDNAYSCDPRIKRFKDKEREEKEAQRKMKEDLQKQKALKQKMVSICEYDKKGKRDICVCTGTTTEGRRG